jgi:hypothetical protein
MALILTRSLSQTHFCKSDNCGISKVTRDCVHRYSLILKVCRYFKPKVIRVKRRQNNPTFIITDINGLQMNQFV